MNRRDLYGLASTGNPISNYISEGITSLRKIISREHLPLDWYSRSLEGSSERIALKHRMVGALHGTAEFALNTYHGLESLGALTNPLAISHLGQIHDAQANRVASLEKGIYNFFDINSNSKSYQSYRNGVNCGLEAGTALAGVYGLTKGGVKLLGKGISSLRSSSFVNKFPKFARTTASKGSITPTNYFRNKTYFEMEKILTKKFGLPKGVGKYNKSFFNSKTQRTFNLHWDPLHRAGKPHIDIRKRGLKSDYYKDRPFFLLEDKA